MLAAVGGVHYLSGKGRPTGQLELISSHQITRIAADGWETSSAAAACS
jgi:hypothetical protein